MIRGSQLALVVLASTAALAVAACGGSPNRSLMDTREGLVASMSPGQTYLDITSPVNGAAYEFNKKTRTFTHNTTAAEVARDAAPLADAISKASNDLPLVNWREINHTGTKLGPVQQDVKTLLRAWGSVYGDLVGSQTSFSIANWTTQLAQDGRRVRAAANIVRADLGLPPVKWRYEGAA